MANISMISSNGSGCTFCGNETTPTDLNESKICYPWVASHFVGRNYTYDDVNGIVMERNIVGIAYLGIVIVLGIVGNVHVLLVFSKRRYKSNYIQDRIHANYRIFVLWLSTLSIIECAVVAPLLIVYLVYPVTYPSNVLCKIFRFVLYFVPVTMNLTLIAIAVDRYLVICRTFENKLTPKHSKIMCTLTIVISLVLSWPAPIVFGNGKTETGIPGLTGKRCYLEDISVTKLQQFYQAFLVLFFFLVMFTLLILYTKVQRGYKKLIQFRRTSRRYSASTPESLKRAQARQESQRVWIYGSVTIGYVVCAMPYHILAILWFAGVIVDCTLTLGQAQAFYMFIWSYFFSPVIYPFIYGFQDDGFRYSVQALYKHSKDSLKRQLFDKRNLANGGLNSDTCLRKGSQPQTQNTEISSCNGSDHRHSISYRDTGERDSELREIITSIAAITLNVSEGIVQEDINKNSVRL